MVVWSPWLIHRTIIMQLCWVSQGFSIAGQHHCSHDRTIFSWQNLPHPKSQLFPQIFSKPESPPVGNRKMHTARCVTSPLFANGLLAFGLFELSPKTVFNQESPPTRTQELYRPPRSKFSLCCSESWRGEEGVPPSSPDWEGGVPHPDTTGRGVPSQPARWGIPQLVRWGYPLIRTGWGYPPVRKDGGTPIPVEVWTDKLKTDAGVNLGGSIHLIAVNWQCTCCEMVKNFYYFFVNFFYSFIIIYILAVML